MDLRQTGGRPLRTGVDSLTATHTDSKLGLKSRSQLSKSLSASKA